MKMQEINDAYHQIEKILSSDDNDENGDDEIGSDSESEADYANMSKAAKKRARRRKNKQRHNEEAEFEKKMDEEMRNFQRAQWNAQRGFPVDGSFSHQYTATSFASTSEAPPKSNHGCKGKGKSKAAKKRAKKRAAAAKNENGQVHYQCGSNNNSNNSNAGGRGGSGNTASSNNDVPFHRLSPEKRCEIKFGSSHLVKSPAFTAMLAKTYNMLMFVLMAFHDPGDPIPLPDDEEKNIFVTPLMVASYLGDYAAADIVIQSLEDRWAEAILAKSHGGDDCLSLAMEAEDIAMKLYVEARGYMSTLR